MEDFFFTSITLNHNYAAKMHVDKGNEGTSYIVGLGDYENGGLWILDKEAYEALGARHSLAEEEEDQDGLAWQLVEDHMPGFQIGTWIPGRVHDIKNRRLKFDGNIPHK